MCPPLGFTTFAVRSGRPPREGGHSASPLPPPIGAIFKACFFRSNKLLRQRVEKPQQPCGPGVTGGRKPARFLADCLPLWPIVRKTANMRDRVLDVQSSVLPQGAEITKSTGGFHQTFIVLSKAKSTAGRGSRPCKRQDRSETRITGVFIF